MNDASASVYICNGDRPRSTLVDNGYPGSRLEFIRCDGSEAHKAARTVVERYFGRLKSLWKAVGRKWERGAKWHSLVIRAAFILTNMVITYSAGLNSSDHN